jgi:ubiquinone/menaquinone biosynthesis C-methylase UbiE
MPILPEPKREHPSTYFVEDRSNQEELKRLQIQDHMLTVGMGGVLPEQPDATRFSRVLDIGCGTGDWLIELEKTTPTSVLLVGVDTSRTFIEYARAQAEAAQVHDRVEFHVMDALRMLEFPNHFFDLVNQRFAGSWLRTWDWPKLLSEYMRVVQPGGVIRLTEPYLFPEENSPALAHLSELMRQAFDQSGHLFAPRQDGITTELEPMLNRLGLEEVHTRAYVLEYHAGTPQWQRFFEDTKHMLRTLLPFFQKWAHVPGDYQEICQQAFHEMQQPDFVATMHLLTAWGKAPKAKYQSEGNHPR